MAGVTKEEADTWIERWIGKGVGREQSNQAYNQGAAKYEEVVSLTDYHGPQKAAETTGRLIPDRGARILDIGAGTGLVGEELRKLGFSRLEALDPSEGMLAQAEKKNIYLRLICACLSDQPLDIPPDTYDVIVGAGCMGENQLPSSAFIEMARILKPGGRVILVTKDNYLLTVKEYTDNYERIMRQLEAEGQLEPEQSYTYPGHFQDCRGLVLIYKKPYKA